MRMRTMIDRRKRLSALAMAAAVTALLLLSGCSSDAKAEKAGAASGSGSADDERYGIAFSTSPGTFKLNEDAVLYVDVTKDGAPVKDANVVLELWPKDADANDHAQMIAQADGKGGYALKGQFSEKGTYYVIAHVTPKETGQMIMSGFDFEVAP